jgi:hypothetical protein
MLAFMNTLCDNSQGKHYHDYMHGRTTAYRFVSMSTVSVTIFLGPTCTAAQTKVCQQLAVIFIDSSATSRDSSTLDGLAACRVGVNPGDPRSSMRGQVYSLKA